MYGGLNVYVLYQYDHLEFPGVVPRTFIGKLHIFPGALLVSVLASPIILVMSFLHLPKTHGLIAVRLALGCITLSTLRFFRAQVRYKFGSQVEAFFVILTAFQFHLLFYCTRPLPNILALGIVNLAYGFWLKGDFYAALNCLVFYVSAEKFALRHLGSDQRKVFCVPSLFSLDTFLPLLGALLDRRVLPFVIPVFTFVLLYSKLPHKELRFIISSVPIFNLSAAVAASRILGCTAVTFMASYENYPSGYALKYLHQIGEFSFPLPKLNEYCCHTSKDIARGHLASNTEEQWVHIDPYSAMNGISRFCENDFPWRYSKEESIPLKEYQNRNFTYLINEHLLVEGYKCLFSMDGFSRVRPQLRFPPFLLIKEPKVYVHGNIKNEDLMNKNWPGCYYANSCIATVVLLYGTMVVVYATWNQDVPTCATNNT
ncbi:Dol-P-Man:Man(7)GlcNAc(2)-PP-Dol alpha-1,6-mannosyltransferase [Citrus sinensis]|uniref:Dol-P-Man:Man(7)GlcNAc(2)-PP-Dol alpha-1,6-mannosyltransferase n=1 Tax=Citrus sinensis TaxID=2711 RepID=A0ACB8MTJ5_CITSI|nr:Dol-P-Man:Man(7)GlcNAc(2)-PP-Dol alpha-1,6-mannosyltransferase [Citrus sinensis]KAH9788720.1 Dol-P-Man:Man(7)GlcNAc(2)-PP-Dol alpha-1,6-mannosyltransferase [Citrus sinensis]